MCNGGIHSRIVPSSRLVDEIDVIAVGDKVAFKTVPNKRQNKPRVADERIDMGVITMEGMCQYSSSMENKLHSETTYFLRVLGSLRHSQPLGRGPRAEFGSAIVDDAASCASLRVVCQAFLLARFVVQPPAVQWRHHPFRGAIVRASAVQERHLRDFRCCCFLTKHTLPCLNLKKSVGPRRLLCTHVCSACLRFLVCQRSLSLSTI